MFKTKAKIQDDRQFTHDKSVVITIQPYANKLEYIHQDKTVYKDSESLKEFQNARRTLMSDMRQLTLYLLHNLSSSGISNHSNSKEAREERLFFNILKKLNRL